MKQISRIILCMSAAAAIASSAISSEFQDAAARQAMLQLPLAFEETLEPGVFVCKSAGYRARVSSEGLDFSVASDEGHKAWSLRFVGRYDKHQVQAHDALPGHIHRLLGNDSNAWRRGLRRYGKLLVPEIYPGIDLAVRGSGRRLEYDFVLEPGARSSDLRMRLVGVQSVVLEDDGSLTLDLDGAKIHKKAPIAFQHFGTEKRLVPCSFVVHRDQSVGFRVGHYDDQRELVIDPVIQYGSYLGGSGVDAVLDFERDAKGNYYLCGYTESSTFPVKGAVQGTLKGTYDGFVAKIDGATKTLAWATYLGGTGTYKDHERAIALAVDAAGNVIVTGRTNAADFPVVAAMQPKLAGAYDAFVSKISADGSKLLYSTYLGGSSDENAISNIAASAYGGDIAIDAAGNAIVTGTTFSADYPTLNAWQGNFGGAADAFLTQIDPQGKHLLSTYHGGSNQEQGRALRVDSKGIIHLAGATVSKDFPVTTGTYRATKLLGFVSRFSANARALLGAMTIDAAPQCLDLDSQGNVYIAGGTSNPNYPVTRGALQTETYGATSHRSGIYAFVTKVDPTLSRLVYSTFYGIASADETVTDMEIDAFGHAVLALGIVSGRSSPSYGVSIAKLNPSGTALSYDFHLPVAATSPAGLELDPNGGIHLGGNTSSTNFPVSAGAFQKTLSGRNDGFVASFSDVAAGIASVKFPLAKLERGKTMPGVVTLDGRVQSSAVTVTLTIQSTGGVSAPASVVIPVGSSSAAFQVTSQTSAAIQTVLVSATWGQSSQKASFAIWDGPEYRITFLGALGGDRKVYGYGINNAGSSTGTARNTSYSYDIFIHDDQKGMRSIGNGGGSAINDAGQIVGAIGRSAVLWDPLKGYTTIPLPASSTWGAAIDLNASGAVVGWYTGTRGNLAFLWTATKGSIGLGDLGGGSSTAYGINDLGIVVGEGYLSSGMRHAIRWDPTTGMKSLGVLPGHDYSTAHAINNRGEIVGVSAPLYSQSQEAFLHIPGSGMKGLGMLKGHAKSLAYDINEHRQIVGFSAGSSFNDKSAVVYDDARGMRRLGDLIDPDDLFGWDLQEARSINDHGQILGNGTFKGNLGTFSAFRLDPIGYTAYGKGCRGANGKSPVLSGIGVPKLGRKTDIVLTHAKPNSLALMFLGANRASVVLPGGCNLLVGPTPIYFGLALATDATGRSVLPLTIPGGSTPLRVTFQALVLDQASGNGLFAASNGLAMEAR